jgi:hypothetical protein
MFGPYLSGYADTKTKRIIRYEEKKIEAVEMKQIP